MAPTLPDMTDPKTLLEWHIAMGADEAISPTSINRFETPEPAPTSRTNSPHQKADPNATRQSTETHQAPTRVLARPVQPTNGAGVEAASTAAAACNTITELKTALESFDGGHLKRSAKNTVFATGDPDSPLMVIGDVPGGEEDRNGEPFVGPAGQLLDKMLAAINMGRDDGAYLTNFIPWRPLGNTAPDQNVIAMLQPFVERHIVLAAPKILMILGGLPLKSLFKTTDSISRHRGKWKELELDGQNFTVMATYHPDFLINQPLQKAASWQDLLAIREKLASL